MKKIMFSVVSVVAALLISVVMISCGGGGGGGGGSSSGGSGVLSGEQGEPVGTTVYSSSQAFPDGFFKSPAGTGGVSAGALWINVNNTNSALYFIDATHARTVSRVGTSNTWEYNPGDGYFNVEISGASANSYVRFSASGAYPARYAYNIDDSSLVISNSRHGTKRYTRAPSGWRVN
ncbi:MAG: hypothetical protein IKZ86_04220 [Spirochaetaceae bacterium]|nr:hypothetical protein [Spirochaetaceae bacterium]